MGSQTGDDLMRATIKAVGFLLAMGAAATTTSAMADGSLKDAPAPAADAREFKFSWNAGYGTNYIFRGVSQSADRGSANGGIDLTYGIAYAGIALSTINFGKDAFNGKDIARLETDFYAGIKPVVGPVTFDIGVIAYTYPSAVYGVAHTFADSPTYVEGKLGASGEIYKNARIGTGSLGATLFYSPEYQFRSGHVTTLEATYSHAFNEVGKITPTFSALIGKQWGSSNLNYVGFFGNGNTSFTYWNAGMTFALDKWSLDLRYWDSDLKHNAGGAAFCTGSVFQCGSKFMGSIKYTY